MKMISMIPAAAVVAALAAAAPAHAGTANGSIPVSALVLETCIVVATPMAFGSLTDVGAADVDTTSTITLTCTPNADYDIALNDGANADAGQRRMKNGTSAEFLNYDVYMDAARTDAWGNSAGVNTKAGTAPLGVAIHTAYGRIPAGVDGVSAGLYSDTVTVTVTF